MQGTADSGWLIGRKLLLAWRNPSLVILTTIHPILGLLLFRYVLGGTNGSLDRDRCSESRVLSVRVARPGSG